MDISKLKRDPKAIHGILKTQKDGSVVCTQPCNIYIPVSFSDHPLADIGKDTSIIGFFAIVSGNKYGVSKAIAMMHIEPTTTNTVYIDDTPYYEFIFEKGSRVIVSNELVKTNTLVYYLSDHIISKGNNPWYLDYTDIAEIFDSASHHAGANLAVDLAIFEMIAATRARTPKDRTKYLRHSLKTQDDYANADRVFIPLKNISLGATNTTAKLMGAYFNEGLSSALVNPATRSEKIEELLRR